MTVSIRSASGEAAAASRRSLGFLASLGGVALSRLGWAAGQLVSLGPPLPWYSIASILDLGALRREDTLPTWRHLVLLDGVPVGALDVDPRVEGGFERFSPEADALELIRSLQLALAWAGSVAKEGGGVPELYGLTERQFGIRMLVVEGSDRHLFPLKPAPDGVGTRDAATASEIALALERWRAKLAID